MNRDAARTHLAAAPGWRTPTRSQGANNCVELTTAVDGWIGIRDSKLGAASPILPLTPAEFTALLRRLRISVS